jgi:hypothetical protein
MLTREISRKETLAKNRQKEWMSFWKLLHGLIHTLDSTDGLLFASFAKSHCGERGTELPGLGLAD